MEIMSDNYVTIDNVLEGNATMNVTTVSAIGIADTTRIQEEGELN